MTSRGILTTEEIARLESAARPDDPTRLPDHRTPGPPDIRTMDTRDGPTGAGVGAAGASEAERGR